MKPDNLKKINYISHYYKEYAGRLFQFYPEGTWDEDKMTYNESLIKYPKNKYIWERVKGA